MIPLISSKCAQLFSHRHTSKNLFPQLSVSRKVHETTKPVIEHLIKEHGNTIRTLGPSVTIAKAALGGMLALLGATGTVVWYISNVPTHNDLEKVRAEIHDVRTELKAEIHDVKQDIRSINGRLDNLSNQMQSLTTALLLNSKIQESKEC